MAENSVATRLPGYMKEVTLSSAGALLEQWIACLYCKIILKNSIVFGRPGAAKCCDVEFILVCCLITR